MTIRTAIIAAVIGLSNLAASYGLAWHAASICDPEAGAVRILAGVMSVALGLVGIFTFILAINIWGKVNKIDL